MLRSTLKRNLLPIALITLGCLIFLAIILYVFRAYLGIVIWVLFGLLLIGIGVIGIVVNNPKNKIGAGDTPSRSSPAGPGTPPPAKAPIFSAVGTREIKPGRQDTITVSRPLLIAAGVLFVCLVLLLVGTAGTVLRSLLTVRQTQIIDCQEAADYAGEGWQFVSTYAYRSGDEVSGYMDHTVCVMERGRFVWARDKRTPKKDDASTDEASIDDASPDADTDILDPAAFLDPTQPHLPPPLDTPAPLPTATFEPVSSPLPTWTPPPFTPEPTVTPLPPSPTPTPIPRTDIVVCDAILEDTYLNIYVQWEGMIIDTPTFEDEGLWFPVEWTNPDLDGLCDRAVFFVSYDGTERFFEEDIVIVTGAIIDTAYEDEGESGETEYFIVVRADNVEFVGE
jgi:hypothetical protein